MRPGCQVWFDLLSSHRVSSSYLKEAQKSSKWGKQMEITLELKKMRHKKAEMAEIKVSLRPMISSIKLTVAILIISDYMVIYTFHYSK